MPMNGYTFSLELPVRDYELDSEGIVNNAVYLHYLEHTRHAFVRSCGCSFSQMRSEGLTPVVSRVEVDYKSPLRSGDVMQSCLWVERQGVRFVFHQDIYNSQTGQMVLRAVVSVVTLVGGRLTRGDELWRRLGMNDE